MVNWPVFSKNAVNQKFYLLVSTSKKKDVEFHSVNSGEIQQTFPMLHGAGSPYQ